MARVNRYFTPQRGAYVSQYADYRLPYEAIQNAVIGRQQRFDTNQAMLAQAGQQYGQLPSRVADAEAKDSMINEYLNRVNTTVNDKYSGDFSLAAGDIYDETVKFTSDPRWMAIKDAYEQEQMFQQLAQQAQAAGKDIYEYSDSTRNTPVINPDGSINPINYHQEIRLTDSENRKLREQYFDDKQYSEYMDPDLAKKLSRAAATSTDAFLGIMRSQGVNFNDTYIGQAANDYIGSNPQEYRILVDENIAKGMSPEEAAQIAKGEIGRRMVNTANEFEYNRTTMDIKQNPYLQVGNEDGSTSPGPTVEVSGTPAFDFFTDNPVLSEMGYESPEDFSDIQQFENINLEELSPDSPEYKAASTARRTAKLIKENTHRDIMQAGGAGAKAYKNLESYFEDPGGQQTIRRLSENVATTALENPSAEDIETLNKLMTDYLNPNVDPTSDSPFLDGLSAMGSTVGNVFKAMFKNVGSIVPDFKSIEEVQKSIEEVGLAKSEYNIKNATSSEWIPKMVTFALNNDAFREKVGIKAKPKKQEQGVHPLFDIFRSTGINDVIDENSENSLKTLDIRKDQFKNQYVSEFNDRISNNKTLTGEKVFLSSLESKDFDMMENALNEGISQTLINSNIDEVFDDDNADYVKKYIKQNLGELLTGTSSWLFRNPVSGDSEIHMDPVQLNLGFDADALEGKTVKLKLSEELQNMVNDVLKSDGTAAIDDYQQAKDLVLESGIRGLDVRFDNKETGGFIMVKNGEDYTGKQAIADLLSRGDDDSAMRLAGLLRSMGGEELLNQPITAPYRRISEEDLVEIAKNSDDLNVVSKHSNKLILAALRGELEPIVNLITQLKQNEQR